MDFILYMTTIGGRVDLEAPDAANAVRLAIEQEAATGQPGALVIGLSCRHPDDGEFRAVSDKVLARIPGTVAHNADSYFFGCACGCSHRLSAEIGETIRALGIRTVVTTPDGSWWVPRVWIAAHGFKADDLPALAKANRWEQIA